MTTTPIVQSVSITDPAFLKGALERAVKTFFQGLAAFPAFSAVVSGSDVGDLPHEVLQASVWESALVNAAILALFSIITSVANPAFVAGGNLEPFQTARQPEAYAPGSGTMSSGSTATTAEDRVEEAVGADDTEVSPVARDVTVEAEDLSTR